MQVLEVCERFDVQKRWQVKASRHVASTRGCLQTRQTCEPNSSLGVQKDVGMLEIKN